MNVFTSSPQVSHHKRTSQHKRGPQHKRPNSNDKVRLLLIIWLLMAFVAVLVIYLITRDATIVILWTSYIGVIAIVFAYFFKER